MMIKRALSCLPVLALVVSLVPGIPARADAVGDLLAKHKAYVGFTFGDGTISSLETVMSYTADKDGSVEATEDDKYLGILTRADIVDLTDKSSYSTGFTGRISWRSDANGITVPIIGDAAKEAFASTLIWTDAVSAEPWTLGDTAQIDGATYQIVHVVAPNALPIDLYVDPSTGAFKRATIDPGGDYEEVLDILAYADALPGKKIISKFKFDSADYSGTYTHIKANGEISGLDLHPPDPTATWTFANSQPFPIKVGGNSFIVKARVNGVEGTFIMDTGADGFFFSQDFAQRAKIHELAKSEAEGIAGSMQTHVGRADTIELGGNTFNNVGVTYGGKGISDDAPDGLLGYDLFAAAFVTLDIAHSTMQIQDPATADASAIQGVHVGVDLSSGQPAVPVVVNGTANLYAVLDSGDAAEVLIPHDFTTKNHLKMLIDDSIQGYLASHMDIEGVSGDYESDECGRLDTIALGPIVYQDAGACKSTSFTGHNGLVGFDFLKNFAQLVFDYQHADMIFVPQQ